MRPAPLISLGDEDDYDASYKIVLAGDPAVGKTSIFQQLSRGIVNRSTNSTIGVDFSTKIFNLRSGAKVKAQLWDTAGQEKYRGIAATHYRKAKGALLVYDITRKQTYDYLTQWLEEIRNNADESAVILLVGNKVDLVEQNPSSRQVRIDEAQKFAKEFKLHFKEMSAFRQDDVVPIFENLLETIHKSQKLPPVSPSSAMSDAVVLARPVKLQEVKAETKCCSCC
eukprot:TRINITY_DN4597_c0_g1_i1.p1 TRINITY_DN4597_c0_g1~~TRINITY_DN4597_c0_g1_i1.p1  ORF type:complete len:225 (+),score=41.88 TRINITY_DN4597_c0_g1_i1:20-694(+)